MKIRPAGVGLQEVVDYLTEQYTYLDGDVESQATTALLACVKNGTVCVLTNGRYKLVVPSAKNMVSNCITRSSHGPRCCCLRVIRKMLSSFPDTCCTLKEVEHRRNKNQSDAMKRERTRRIKRSVKPKTFLCLNPKKIARETIEKEEKKKEEEKKEEEKKVEEEKKPEEVKVEPHKHETCPRRERKRRERKERKERKEIVKSKKMNKHGDGGHKDCKEREKSEHEKCKTVKRKEKSEGEKAKTENGKERKEKNREKEKRDKEAEERKRRTEMKREKILRKRREIRCVHQVLGLDSFLFVEVCSDNCHLIKCPFCLNCHPLPGKNSECTLCQTYGVPRDVFSPRDQSL